MGVKVHPDDVITRSRNLFGAVVRRAVQDALSPVTGSNIGIKNPYKRTKTIREARRWLEETVEEHDPEERGLAYYCDMIDTEAGVIVDKLKRKLNL